MIPSKLRTKLYPKYEDDERTMACKELFLKGKLDDECTCEVCEDIRDIAAKKQGIERTRVVHGKIKSVEPKPEPEPEVMTPIEPEEEPEPEPEPVIEETEPIE